MVAIFKSPSSSHHQLSSGVMRTGLTSLTLDALLLGISSYSNPPAYSLGKVEKNMLPSPPFKPNILPQLWLQRNYFGSRLSFKNYTYQELQILWHVQTHRHPLSFFTWPNCKQATPLGMHPLLWNVGLYYYKVSSESQTSSLPFRNLFFSFANTFNDLMQGRVMRYVNSSNLLPRYF